MTPGQIDLIIKRSLLTEQLNRVSSNAYLTLDLGCLFQLLVGDAARIFPDVDVVPIMDQSPVVLDFVTNLCEIATAKVAKDFIIYLGSIGFDNLHYNLVCKYHLAFSQYEFFRLQPEAQNLMTLIR